MPIPMDPTKVAAIIPAAGKGIRMGQPEPKQFLALQGDPILIHTLRVFQQIVSIGYIVVVVPAAYRSTVEDLIRHHGLTKVYMVIAGGKERQDSVRAGLGVLPEEVELVLVHDGVRPFVPVSVVESCLQEAENYGAAMVAVPVKDTLKIVSDQKVVEHTVKRDGVWQAQTPQAAAKSLLNRAYRRLALAKEHYIATDEAGLLELLGHPVKVVEGSEMNIKITRQEDLTLAMAILMKNNEEQVNREKKVMFCSGYGYDAHRLVTDRLLILGGEEIPYEKGLLGHSDADVLTHSFCDAMLGAAGAGDIGRHFPDNDQRFKDISSLGMLAVVVELVSQKGYALENADITVVAQKPRLAPYFSSMRKNLATVCGVAPNIINIKATTTEEMGFEGRGEGMSSHAVVMLSRNRHNC